MSSQLSPTFAFPPAARPRRTLVRAGAAAAAFLSLLLAGGGWRYAINQSEAQILRENTIASLRRSVIAVTPKHRFSRAPTVI
jgi:multidrug efflux system membrane fusion protein